MLNFMQTHERLSDVVVGQAPARSRCCRKLCVLWVFPLIYVAALCCAPSIAAESLETVETRRCDLGQPPCSMRTGSALLLGKDTTIVWAYGSKAGLWAQYGQAQNWRKLIGAIPTTGSWWDDCHRVERFEDLFAVQILTMNPSRDELLLYDSYCNCLLRFRVPDSGPAYADVAISDFDGYWIDCVALQGSTLLGGVHSVADDKFVLVSDIARLGRHRAVFECTPDLRSRFDSVWLRNIECLPALCATDSAVWVPINGHNVIYVTDLDGNVQDSVPIEAHDYLTPRPPRSRVHTTAVWREWASHWTPIVDFRYVEPGYLVLRYQSYRELLDESTTAGYSTLVWNTDRQPVELEVDKTWRLVGVQPDGRMLFAHPDEENGSGREVIEITRIVP